MTPERWQQVKRLLESALERNPVERADLLDNACKDDPSLRREVESLIASHEQAQHLFELPAFEAGAGPLASDRAELVGRRIGDYKFLEQIGRGGMGEVYLAHDSRLGRRVALKLLPSRYTADEQRVRRFEQEARAASALNHPNILMIFEIGGVDGIQFIATEYVEGETLRQRMAGARMSLSEALEVAIQVASALVAAHQAGIVHRDVKPENVMLRPDGYVKVLDFGLAKLTEQPAASDTGALTFGKVDTDPGTVMGTASYMSPEQARGQTVDSRTDIFSLGVVMYEMIAGRAPFEGETTSDVIASILKTEPPPLAHYSGKAPDALERLVAKTLRKDREERCQTAKELLTDLKKLKQRLDFEAEQQRSVSPDVSGVAADNISREQIIVDTDNKPVAKTGDAAARTTSSAEIIIEEIKRHKFGAALALLAFVLVAGGIGFAIYRLAGKRPAATDSNAPFSKVRPTRLTTTGRASIAAISPDGKYVAHAVGAKAQQSLWLRHIATGSDKEIVPAAPVDYESLSFSPDGNYIYFLRWEAVEGGLYRVPVLGGSMKVLVRDVDSGITVSPDGQQLAYMRGYPQRDEAVLATANADGTEEQALVTKHGQRDVLPGPGIAWGPAWSPDGETIAFALRKAEADGNYWNVVTVRVKDKSEQQVSFQKWSSLGQLAWLRDGSGLIVAAADRETAPAQQIWYVSYPSGGARKITNDTNGYRGVSLTADSTALLTVQSEQNSNIWIAPGGDASRAAQITSNNFDGLNGVCWTPEGRILYTSRNALGRSSIWMMNADGTGQKQLTVDAPSINKPSISNIRPSVSPDGRYIIFVSDRTGNYCVWRMDVDGSNPKQLSSGTYATRPQITPDGQWVVYTDTESGKQRLWKVSIDGGDPVQLTDYTSAGVAVSPDGRQIAFRFVDEQATPKRQRVAITPIEGGAPSKVLDLPLSIGLEQTIRWTPDGRALLDLDSRNGVSNIWIHPLDGSPAKQLTTFKSDQIFSYAWSRDGRQLVCARGTQTSDAVLITDLR
jgi:serine/threonine protein kinase/Tol biopolymer transport system component